MSATAGSSTRPPSRPPQAGFTASARRLIAARYALVHVPTHEEERLERALAGLAKEAFSQPVPLYLWSVTEGLRSGDQQVAGSEDPIEALRAVIDHPRPAIYLFRDLHRHFDDPRVVRMLRDAHRSLRRTYKTIFISGTSADIPRELHKELATLELPLPDLAEMEAVFSEACAAFPGLDVQLGDQRDAFLRGAMGLTEQEARFCFTRLLLGRRRVDASLIDQLYEEKRQIVGKEGILDYVPHQVRMEDIGGLAGLKAWLRQRSRFFSKDDAVGFGLDPPKGLLVTGISGCGKSMVVQAVAAYWHLPLLRLDMNRVYAGAAGSPEATLERAIRTAEAVAPCVLWIDEIETAVGVGGGKEATGLGFRLFSSFLTWMQEKEQMVFVAATANQIDELPPELLRKGRFDEVFFVDLPEEAERLEIFRVHLTRRGKDPDAFDLISLAKATAGFNGAEIAQVVQSAMYQAFDESREITNTDLFRALGSMVPLSTTMAEKIKEIKRWAQRRAVKAGG